MKLHRKIDLSLVITKHNLKLAKFINRRTAIMNKGEVVEKGANSPLLAQKENP
ncbi:MAG: hypothetical protein N3C62_03365 [Synergistetes bacterium]|nr:hypothetical protein [Synergistota bacterium]